MELLFKQASRCKALRTIIRIDGAVSDAERDMSKETGITIHSMEEVLVSVRGCLVAVLLLHCSFLYQQLGRENPVDVTPPTPDDIATICYTSGTTGEELVM